jgi:hypothetical protein
MLDSKNMKKLEKLGHETTRRKKYMIFSFIEKTYKT